MKTEDQSSVYLDNNFKPPDRSTSAPPVLSLHSESLFAFRAAEHLQLFSDIRCEDYYELYKYQTLEGGKGLAASLENQPFLIDRSYVEEDEHLINPLPHSNQQQLPTHQQQIQQLQQQIQQQQQQIQQQMQFQQQYMQQHVHPQQVHSPHHNSHPQHLQQQYPHAQHMHSQQQHHSHSQLPHTPHQHVQQMQQMQHPHPQHMQQHLPMQHHPNIQHSQFSHLTPLQQQQFQQMQHQQPHVGFTQHRGSVPDTRHPLPRSTSNPSYSMRGHGFEHNIQEEQHLDDDVNESADTIWTPLPRGRMTSNLLEDYLGADEGQHQKRGAHYPHITTPPPQVSQQHDPSSYYQNDFDNVAYSTAKQLLDEGNIQSLWNDGGRQQQQQPRQLTVPTPKNPSQANIISLLGGGYFNEAANPDKPRRNRTNSAGRLLPVPTTSPPLIQPVGPGSASTSPALPICRYYAQGFCSRGERCNFLHDDQSQQTLSQLQDSAPFSVAKPKAKKTVSSPPPMSLPPKVPSPVNIRGNGLHHANSNNLPNGMANGASNGNTTNISSLIKSLGGMNLDRDGRISPTSGLLGLGDRDGRDRERDRERDGSSPQPIPRSVSANGLDLAFNGGSTSPNGKSDLTRQYTSIEQVIGHIYSLCKDQHGCRFLQKKLEDRDPMIVEIIFNEVYDHMTELMIDPFGNYLCQKLLEHCNDEQRLEIIEKVAPDLVKISKNMHGTRAVQKMIEYLTTSEQIAIAKKALSNHVVTLIQDLNGNHVIQRCLNRLSPQDNQFIYDSVSQAGHCVEVATHRHGCCVLQRCIDHASDSQKIQLINEIIANALVLVQDPYGNYVVQYVLDLPFPGLASRLARRFLGHIPILSTQKFSSNVVEKCLNVTDVQTRAAIIQELVEYDNLLYLLQDPYANYVIQTSLNVSEPVQHARLVEAIRPHLTSLRNTPYGKRIQNKILKESSRDYYA